ncbi:hypothetical protein D3C76_1726880 [compost metagenome]
MLQSLQIEAVLLHRHAGQPGTQGAEAVQRADKAGAFADNGVPLIAQHLAGKLNPLLGAGNHKQAVGLPLRPQA